MATICAGRCKLSFIKSNPEELYTYGSPRVGNQRYVQFTRLRHHRWVNNNDIVPTVPPTWLGYRHCGQEWYLNYEGQLRQLHWSGRLLDNWRGLRESIHLRRFDFVADHSMFNYIAAIEGLCRAEEQTLDGMVAAESIGQFITISESKTVVFSEEVTSPQQNSAIIQTETIRRSA
jgi:triacylglycerol lipase